MTDDNITPFPEQKPKSIIGPAFTGNRVIVEGRVIPRLSAREAGDEVHLTLDHRYGLTVPADIAYQVAWFVAQALAIGAGYAHLGAASKDRPFAPEIRVIDSGPGAPA